MLNPEQKPQSGHVAKPVEAAAPSFRVELTTVDVRDAAESSAPSTAFAHYPNGGLIVRPDPVTQGYRNLIIAIAARHRLPAVYAFRSLRQGGGLISYGPRSARPVPARGRYVDRILQGRKAGRPSGATADQVRAGDQPQDRQSARPRNPPNLLARADEVIE